MPRKKMLDDVKVPPDPGGTSDSGMNTPQKGLHAHLLTWKNESLGAEVADQMKREVCRNTG